MTMARRADETKTIRPTVFFETRACGMLSGG